MFIMISPVNPLLEDLKIIAINTNSIISNVRRHNLVNLIIDHNPDILALSETKLNAKHILNITDYSIIRNDRKINSGGGTALIIKNTIQFEIINIKNLTFIETTAIKIKHSEKNLFIISTYIPPRSKDKISTDLNNIFKSLKLEHQNNYFVLIGDLNARHPRFGDSIVNYNGLVLSNWIEANDLEYKLKTLCTTEPTFAKSNAFLDLALIDYRLVCKQNVLEVHDFDSDHKAIGVTINFTHEDNSVNFSEKNKTFLYKKTNWNKFKRNLDIDYDIEIPENTNLSNSEIDKYITDLETYIRKTIEDTTPKLVKKTSTLKYVNNTIEKLYMKKKSLQKAIHRLLKKRIGLAY